MLFDTETQAFLNTQNSVETKRAYGNDLRLWFEQGLPLTVEGAAEYKAWLTRFYKPNGSARRFNTVRTFYRWLAQRKLIEYSPFEAVKAPKRPSGSVPEVPSDEEVEALIGATKTTREAAVVSLLLNGLRASEVSDLTADAMKWTKEYGYYMVVTGKGNKQRIVPVLPETIDALQAFDKDNGIESQHLVHNPDGGRLSFDTVNGIVDMAARKAKVNIHPHSLRHHYATRLIRAGANVFAVQKLLGHASVSTTQIYVSMDISDLVAASGLDPRNLGNGIRLVPSSTPDIEEDSPWLTVAS